MEKIILKVIVVTKKDIKPVSEPFKEEYQYPIE